MVILQDWSKTRGARALRHADMHQYGELVFFFQGRRDFSVASLSQ
jgi:hypothetical protein